MMSRGPRVTKLQVGESPIDKRAVNLLGVHAYHAAEAAIVQDGKSWWPPCQRDRPGKWRILKSLVGRPESIEGSGTQDFSAILAVPEFRV